MCQGDAVTIGGNIEEKRRIDPIGAARTTDKNV
jgi:hypothetical protein